MKQKKAKVTVNMLTTLPVQSFIDIILASLPGEAIPPEGVSSLALTRKVPWHSTLITTHIIVKSAPPSSPRSRQGWGTLNTLAAYNPEIQTHKG